MGAMYRIVGDALVACNPPELQVLGEGRQELVAQFIYVKVLRLDADPDEADERASHSALPPPLPCALTSAAISSTARAPAPSRRKLSIGDQITEAQLEDEIGAGEDLDGCLAEHGLSAQAVQLAARAFIAELLEPRAPAARRGLRQRGRGRLSGIASRHAIASITTARPARPRAQARGVTADYAKTRIGGWLQQTLGIAIEPDNMAAILQVFKILGAEASYA